MTRVNEAERTLLSPRPLRRDRRVPRKRSRSRAASTATAYLFIAPFVISFVLFFVLPSITSAALSFFRYRGYGDATFIGFQNYSAISSSPDFWKGVANTAFYWLVPLVPLLAGAFFLALFVRSKLTRLPGVFKPLLFVPQVMAPVAAALVWKVILDSGGVLNQLLGLDVNWLGDPQAQRWAVILLLLWRAIGWYFVIFLSGLTGVPEELLEAAQLDGANAWQRVRFVILPLMRPIFLFAIVIDTIASIQLFAEPNLLVGSPSSPGGAPPSAAPLMNQVITNIQGGQFGLAAAVGWLMFIAVAVVSVVQFRLFRERDAR